MFFRAGHHQVAIFLTRHLSAVRNFSCHVICKCNYFFRPLLVGAPRLELELNPPKGLVLPLHYAPIYHLTLLLRLLANTDGHSTPVRMSPREESNPHLEIRSLSFYPLNYGECAPARNRTSIASLGNSHSIR